MKILILGCGGFIGSHLIDRLLKRQDTIIGVDRDQYKISEHINKFEFIQGDVYDNLHLIERVDVVIFLASLCNPSLYIKNAVETIMSNAVRPIRVVDECTRLKKWLITFSTCEVYGRTLSSYYGDRYNNPDFYIQNTETTPSVFGGLSKQRWSYACAKLMLDRYVYANGVENNLLWTIIRPYNFFGPRMDYLPGTDGPINGVPRVLACFMRSLITNTPMQVVDGGIAYRTITDIDDATDAIIKIIDRKPYNIVFNIANPINELTIYELAVKIKTIWLELTGGIDNSPIVSVASSDFYGDGYEDCDRRVPDISITQKLLAWEPKICIDESLRKVLVWFYEKYKNT